ncbi:MAG: hypothetical protein GPI94_11305 [Microcystis aeruginosa LG13-03]|nr:hypothetical protein [Microcystis aeruginosa LG13-03]
MNLEMLGQNTSQVEVILILQNLATKEILEFRLTGDDRYEEMAIATRKGRLLGREGDR